MVKRKPVNAGVNRASSGLSYPVTPISPKEATTKALLFPSGAEGSQKLSARLPSSVSTSEMANSTAAWANDDTSKWETRSELPSALRVSEGRPPKDVAHSEGVLPSSLQVGPTNDTPRSSFESQASARLTANREQVSDTNQNIPGSTIRDHKPNNPYLRMRDTDGSPPQGNSADIWAGIAGSPSSRPLEAKYPSRSTCSNSKHMGLMKFSDQPLGIEASALSGGLSERSPFAEPWVELGPSPAQDFLEAGLVFQPNNTTDQDHRDIGNLYSTDGLGRQHTGEFNVDPQEPNRAVHRVPEAQIPDVQLLDGAVNMASQHPSDTAKRLPNIPFDVEDTGPELPSQRSLDVADTPPPRPPRPEVVDVGTQPELLPSGQTNLGNGNSELAETQRQQSKAKKQRSETYQIRLVNWYDASCSTNPRRSPIMVQNANGPCPLLALVNALVLSTPAEVDTALVETLRVREQVSLGLLLDAVIDELMSGRRGDAAQDLPDVSDLYAFLVTLHTGMNVNPCFVTSEAGMLNLMDASASELPITVQESQRPGGFEDTREMRLYSTFAIPLIHGWLPPRNHAAFAALQRSAKTYENAQNLMFMEEELEDKLQREGLSPQEQLMLEDVASVKYFLSSSATQLTGYGLDTMMDALPPGSITILFRNDHFSTLYKHPQSSQLFTLVTDMGYAGHDEVVWESLVDISGEGCEFFSGDFRSIGHNTGKQPSQSTGVGISDDSGWTTVSRNTKQRPRQSLPSDGTQPQNLAGSSTTFPQLSSLSLGEANETPKSPNTEQEDHDLALALQLQEEEEDRERRETAARRREDELSQAYLESQGPSARRGPVRASEVRPVVPPRGGRAAKQPDTGEDAPPSYEQAAKVPAYHPPEDNPLALPGRNGNLARPQGTRPRQSSAYSQNSTAFSGAPSSHNANFAGSSAMRGNTRRRSSARGGGLDGFGGAPAPPPRRNGHQAQGVVTEEEDKKDCIVM